MSKRNGPPHHWCDVATTWRYLTTGKVPAGQEDSLPPNILWVLRYSIMDMLKGRVPEDTFSQIESFVAERKTHPLKEAIAILQNKSKGADLVIGEAYYLGLTEGYRSANKARRADDFRSDAKKIGIGIAAGMVLGMTLCYCFLNNKEQVAKSKVENARSVPVAVPR